MASIPPQVVHVSIVFDTETAARIKHMIAEEISVQLDLATQEGIGVKTDTQQQVTDWWEAMPSDDTENRRAILDDDCRGRVWIDRNGDFWRWYDDGYSYGWQYQSPGNRWRFGTMHISQCGPFTAYGKGGFSDTDTPTGSSGQRFRCESPMPRYLQQQEDQ
jgi:hypothetical protein